MCGRYVRARPRPARARRRSGQRATASRAGPRRRIRDSLARSRLQGARSGRCWVGEGPGERRGRGCTWADGVMEMSGLMSICDCADPKGVGGQGGQLQLAPARTAVESRAAGPAQGTPGVLAGARGRSIIPRCVGRTPPPESRSGLLLAVLPATQRGAIMLYFCSFIRKGTPLGSRSGLHEMSSIRRFQRDLLGCASGTPRGAPLVWPIAPWLI